MDNISNQATLLYNNTTTTSNTVSTQILSLYELSATISSLTDSYTPGQPITYISRIENTGSSSIYNVKIIDDLGNGTLSYLEQSAKAFLNGLPISVESSVNNNTVTFSISNVLNAGDQVIIIFEASSPATNTQSIKTTETIFGNGGSITGQTVTVIPKPTTIVKLASYASLTITKSASSTSIYDGDELNYTFKITNSGNDDAIDVTFSDSFSLGYKINSITLLTANSSTPITYDPASYVSTNILTIPHLTIPVGTTTLTVNGIYHN